MVGVSVEDSHPEFFNSQNYAPYCLWSHDWSNSWHKRDSASFQSHDQILLSWSYFIRDIPRLHGLHTRVPLSLSRYHCGAVSQVSSWCFLQIPWVCAVFAPKLAEIVLQSNRHIFPNPNHACFVFKYNTASKIKCVNMVVSGSSQKGNYGVQWLCWLWTWTVAISRQDVARTFARGVKRGPC